MAMSVLTLAAVPVGAVLGYVLAVVWRLRGSK